jgi:hypothetical protein
MEEGPMADETQPETTPETEAAEAAEAATAPEAEQPAAEIEMVFCAVSKQQVPASETIELERKKGEMLRIHARYKKF